jgi:hypothetical protein
VAVFHHQTAADVQQTGAMSVMAAIGQQEFAAKLFWSNQRLADVSAGAAYAREQLARKDTAMSFDKC